MLNQDRWNSLDESLKLPFRRRRSKGSSKRIQSALREVAVNEMSYHRLGDLIVFHYLMLALPDMSAKRPAVLFACYDNMGRSIIAQTLARRRWGTAARVESAGFSGLAAARLPADPVVLRAVGSRSRRLSRHLDGLRLDRFDWFVAMDDGVAMELRERGVPLERMTIWDFADPPDYSLAAYEDLAKEIATAIEELEPEVFGR